MEGREGTSSGGVTVEGADASANFHLANARRENPSLVGGTTISTTTPVSVGLPGTAVKRKRGRPRKYGPDGTVSLALSPMPISSSAPPLNDFSGEKRGRGRPLGSSNKQQRKMKAENLGEWVACSDGVDFMPHIVTIASGEDVTMKIISFSQQGNRAICILSANGAISNVTLRQPDSSGGTLTYEGRFEILSLSGSFMPTESGGIRNRSGGMSVSLASPDGRVVGGGVAGLLVAATPVQVVVGSFLPSNQQEKKPKKQKTKFSLATSPKAAIPISSAAIEGQSAPKSNPAASSSFHGGNWSSLHPMQDPRNFATDINVSLPED